MQTLRTLQLARLPTPGDGDCLFHAFSHILRVHAGSDISASAIREEIAVFNEQIRHHLDTDLDTLGAAFDAEDPEEMGRDMSLPGTWGGEREIILFATWKQYRVQIITCNGHVQVHEPAIVYDRDYRLGPLPLVTLIFYDHGHYEAAVSDLLCRPRGMYHKITSFISLPASMFTYFICACQQKLFL